VLSDATLKALEQLSLIDFSDMEKSLMNDTAIIAYDLKAPAKELRPFYVLICNDDPTIGEGGKL
jgi:hypothetical protein